MDGLDKLQWHRGKQDGGLNKVNDEGTPGPGRGPGYMKARDWSVHGKTSLQAEVRVIKRVRKLHIDV